MTTSRKVTKQEILDVYATLPAFANAKNTFNSTDTARVGTVYATQIPAVPVASFTTIDQAIRSDEVLAFLDLITNTYSQLRTYTLVQTQNYWVGGNIGFTNWAPVAPYTRVGYRSGFAGNSLLVAADKTPMAKGELIEYTRFTATIAKIQALITSNSLLSGGSLSYCHASCHTSCHASRGRR